MSIEAMKQDADCQQCGGKGCIACDAKEQLVAWVDSDWHYQLHKKGMVIAHLDKSDVLVGEPQPFYVTPQPKRDEASAKAAEWVGLTDDDELNWEEGGNLKDLVKAIETKLKEKNT